MTTPENIEAAFAKALGPVSTEAFVSHAKDMATEALAMCKRAFTKGYEAGYEQASTEAAEDAAGADL